MRFRARWAGMLAALLAGQVAVAQTAPAGPTEITYQRDWAEQLVPFYKFVVRADGSGTFTTDRGTAAGGTEQGSDAVPAADDAQRAEPATAGAAAVVSTVQISAKTMARLFAVETTLRSGKGCEGGNRHLAQTGRKVLTIKDAAGVQTCTFNYSDDKRVEDAVAAFGAMATTLEERPRLEHLRRFDRLGLDAELGSFLESAKAGRAIELANIAPLLKTLTTDDALMDRVRSRAATLLTMAQAGS